MPQVRIRTRRVALYFGIDEFDVLADAAALAKLSHSAYIRTRVLAVAEAELTQCVQAEEKLIAVGEIINGLGRPGGGSAAASHEAHSASHVSHTTPRAEALALMAKHNATRQNGTEKS